MLLKLFAYCVNKRPIHLLCVSALHAAFWSCQIVNLCSITDDAGLKLCSIVVRTVTTRYHSFGTISHFITFSYVEIWVKQTKKIHLYKQGQFKGEEPRQAAMSADTMTLPAVFFKFWFWGASEQLLAKPDTLPPLRLPEESGTPSLESCCRLLMVFTRRKFCHRNSWAKELTSLFMIGAAFVQWKYNWLCVTATRAT